MNKAILLGRIGKDPEVRHFDSGSSVATTTLATTSKHKDKSGAMQEKTEWHNLVIWGKLAEVFEKHVKKGQELLVEGEIQYSSYDDKDGVKKYVTKINVQNMSFVGTKKEDKPGDSAPQESNIPTQEPTDDLPF